MSRFPGKLLPMPRALRTLAVISSAAMVLLVGGASVGCAQAGWGPEPIVVEAVEVQTPSGVARGFVASIRLDDPRVEVLVTGPSAAAIDAGGEAVLEPTDQWALEQDATLAINANFFGKLKRPEGSPTESEIQHGAGSGFADIIGLSVSGGRVVSPAREFNGRPDPSLMITPGGRGEVGYFSTEQTSRAASVIAGVGGSTYDKVAGRMLVESGKNAGASARVDPLIRHPRTGAGVSASGRTLVLAVIDGRQPEWSVGLTLPELADLMIARGVVNAVNLDGGGSSAFVYTSRSGERFTNKPSDGQFRAVANNLGIRLGGQHHGRVPGASVQTSHEYQPARGE